MNYPNQRVVRRVPGAPRPRRRIVTFRRLVILVVIILIMVELQPSLRLPKLFAFGPIYTKKQTVCLDPGHGGADTGAIQGVLDERNLNLTVAFAVRKLLEDKGYRVYMTRTTNNVYLTNHDRYTFCNDHHATILVAIHQNYFYDPSVDYSEALYYKPQDEPLAQSIVDAVSAKLGTTNDNISSFDDGVLAESHMPAALIEGLFMTNTQEYRDLTTRGSDRLTLEAQGIAAGIERYFTAPATPHPQGPDVRPGD